MTSHFTYFVEWLVSSFSVWFNLVPACLATSIRTFSNCARARTHTHTHTHTHSHTHTHLATCVSAFSNHTHTHTHTCARVHTFAHTAAAAD